MLKRLTNAGRASSVNINCIVFDRGKIQIFLFSGGMIDKDPCFSPFTPTLS